MFKETYPEKRPVCFLFVVIKLVGLEEKYLEDVTEEFLGCMEFNQEKAMKLEEILKDNKFVEVKQKIDGLKNIDD